MAVVDADSTWPAPVKGVRRLGFDGLATLWETESARLMVWCPLLLVLGIWTYFSLAREPPFFLVWPVCLATLATILWPRVPRAAKVFAIIVLGFGLAQLRTHWIATPVLRAYAPDQQIIGYVADLDVRSRQRFTLVLEVLAAPGLPPGEVPNRITVSVTGKHQPPRVGDTVRMTADLMPLPRPAQPGGFEYGRQLYFRSIGATARSTSGVDVIPQPVPWHLTVRRAFHDLRAAIGTRVREAIPGPLGSFADALITGERATIPRSMNNSLRESGLFHILSISGLHMALVAGGAFWVMRALLALSQTLALRWPIKKWSAAVALVVGLFYMLLADSGPATERSFIMIAVVFFAVLVNRPALSMHNLSLAATLILLTAPEQALSASFQMSFMAVMGLAAFFSCWQSRAQASAIMGATSRAARVVGRFWRLILASIATSLVAGLLSGIPAAHHFGRLAPYAVFANALALPVVSAVVMPAAMASVLLMPIGLEVLPLKVMASGLWLVMRISDWVAGWPGAGLRLPKLGTMEAALLSIGVALLLLPRTRLRFAAAPVFLAAGLVSLAPKPGLVLLVDERAGNVAVQTPQGLVPALQRNAAASVSRWLAQAGENVSFKEAASRTAWTCTPQQCTSSAQGLTVAYLLKSASPFLQCPHADVLISQQPLRRRCKGNRLTIDRFDVWRNGAYAVFADGTARHVRGLQGQRPWVYEPRARAQKP